MSFGIATMTFIYFISKNTGKHPCRLQIFSSSNMIENILSHCHNQRLSRICMYCKKVLVTSTIFWLPQLHSFCVHDTKFKECLEFVQNVVEKLPSFVILENVEHCGGEPERTDTGILCHWWIDEWCNIFKTFNVQCKLTRWIPHYVTPRWWIRWMRQTPHHVRVVYHWA